jgi:hypothetical protein
MEFIICPATALNDLAISPDNVEIKRGPFLKALFLTSISGVSRKKSR